MSNARILVLSLLALTTYGCKTTRMHESIDDAAGVVAAKGAYFSAWTKSPGEAFTLEKLSRVIDTSNGFVSFDGMSQQKTVIQGWKAYSGIWEPGMNGFKSGSITESQSLSTWTNEAMAMTASIVRIQGETLDGNKLDLLGHLTLGLEKHDGAWRIVHEHMSLGVKP